MRSNAEAFRGGLASALLTKKYADVEMPDFEGVPQVFGKRNPEDLPLNERITELYLLVGECVVRRNANATLSFLKTKPFSSASQKAFEALSSSLEGCVPAEISQDIEAERMRGVIAQAAYYVDLTHETNEAGAD